MVTGTHLPPDPEACALGRWRVWGQRSRRPRRCPVAGPGSHVQRARGRAPRLTSSPEPSRSGAVSAGVDRRYYLCSSGPRPCHPTSDEVSAAVGGHRLEAVGSTPWAGRRGRTRRSLADPWDRVASRSAHPGPRARRHSPRPRERVRVLSVRHGKPVAGTPEEEFLARRGQRQPGARRTAPRNQRRARDLDNDGIIPVLARAVREVEAGAQRGPVRPAGRTTFQVVALLVREERARVKADRTSSEAQRAEQLKRLDGVATILARTAARDTSLLALLAEDAVMSGAAASLRRDMLLAAGVEPAAEEVTTHHRGRGRHADDRAPGRAAVGRLPPAGQPLPRARLLLSRAGQATRLGPPGRLGAARPAVPVVRVAGGASSCMDLPEPSSLRAPGGMELMHHQAQLIRGRGVGTPDVPARRRAGPGQDGPGAARRPGRERVPAARRRTERRQDQLGPRGGSLDSRSRRHRHPRQR